MCKESRHKQWQENKNKSSSAFRWLGEITVLKTEDGIDVGVKGRLVWSRRRLKVHM